MRKRTFFLEHTRFFASIRHAWRGMRIAFREEQNMRIHALCAIAALFFAALLGVRALEFAALTISIALVLAMEIMNSIVERLCDMIKPQMSHLIAAAKDMSAAAVLVCALNACIVGGVIFLPKLLSFFRGILS